MLNSNFLVRFFYETIACYRLIVIMVLIGDDSRRTEIEKQITTMDDRRKYDRKLLTYFSSVIDRNTGMLLGYLVDMTTGGALMKGNLPLEVNSVFQLCIDLPDKFTSKKFVEIQAKAVWSTPDTDPDFYLTGLQLIDIDPGDLFILERLIEDYGLNAIR
jgi:hypothetical protein